MKALIDTEYYLYRCAAGAEQEINWAGDDWTYVCRHSDAKLAFEEIMREFLEALIGFQPVLVFAGGSSFRRSLWPAYKANRKKLRKPAGYSALTEWVMTVSAGRGWDIARLPEVEGDDALGVLYGDGDVIVSEDKDMLTLPGNHLRAGELMTISRREADLAFYCQALTGDSSDNYPGCPKYGPVTANKLLAGSEDEREMWLRVLGAYEKAGFNERYAITQARCARILRTGEYDHEKGIPILWCPPVT